MDPIGHCDRCDTPTPLDELQLPANEKLDDEWICPTCYKRSAAARRVYASRRRGQARRASLLPTT